jgi:hypothetical protein
MRLSADNPECIAKNYEVSVGACWPGSLRQHALPSPPILRTPHIVHRDALPVFFYPTSDSPERSGE